VKQEFAPGFNKLPEATTIHWHGILVANNMDGVTGLNQKLIKPEKSLPMNLCSNSMAPTCTILILTR
jgi:FtsP/CotA-like multicopper oxidase with cupredoxin domain